MYRKGGGKGQLCFLGHVLVDNRNGLVADTETTLATGFRWRAAAVCPARRLHRPGGAERPWWDEGYDQLGGGREAARSITPDVAQRVKGAAIEQSWYP